MSQPRYIQDQGAWLIPAPPAADCEVLVAGDSDGPYAGELAEAETVLLSLQSLRDRAAAYLDGFVSREQLAPGSDWFLEGIEFGLSDRANGRFAIAFSLEGDTYGGWSVTFQLSSGQYVPTAFGRHQI